jgi:hypothetical protein
MKKYTFGFFALATALAITPSALAYPLIVGTIGISGGNDKWDSSGSFVTFTTPSGNVSDNSVNFSVILTGTAVTINNSHFLSATPDGLFLTTASSGGNIATFTITGPVNVTQPLNTQGNIGGTGEYLDVSGTGILNLTGYAPTLATFSFDSTDSNQQYGANSSTYGIDITSQGVPAVPEPGTLSLFGTGLLGLAGLLRRKLAK